MRQPITISFESDYYGTYWLECVGVIDYLALIKSMPADDYLRWNERFHPTRYFLGFSSHTLHQHTDRQGKDLHASREVLFVPTARANEAWDFSASAYSKAVSGRKRSFPAAESEKRIQKWQSSIAGNVLTPSWLAQCVSIEDVMAMDAEQSRACPHCWM